MNAGLPLWAEVTVAALLVSSGIFVLISAAGYWRLQDFFVRMHPPALAYTFGSWCVALASVLYFSIREGRLALHPVLILLLCVTVPVTTLLLARVALFRRRVAGLADTPPPLSPPRRS